MLNIYIVSLFFGKHATKFRKKGTYKVQNEIETKRNEINKIETKRNQRNQRKQNEINENKTKYYARLLPTHVSVSFIRRGQDLITIEQEYSGSLSFSLSGFF